MEELISVVIATYKREKELDRAIKSVLNQSYKNIEIIVVDDNGLNSEWQIKTEKIMGQYKDYSNINYIVNENNKGGSLTRNAGIQSSKGEYIAFLDDDDEYYPTKLEKQINLFKKSNNFKLALVYCYTDSYDENNKKLKEYKYDYRENCLVDAMCDCIAATSQWLCKKECLLDVENFTDVPCKQDSTVIIKLLDKGYEVDRVPEVLVKYNEHSNTRISGGGIKNITGEKLLRNLCRSLYYKIESNQILQVESAFSYRLSKLYINNKLNNELHQEMKTLKLANKSRWLKVLIYYYLKKYTKILD